MPADITFGYLDNDLCQLAQDLGVDLEPRVYTYLVTELGGDGWMPHRCFKLLDQSVRVRILQVMTSYLFTPASTPHFQRVSVIKL